MKVCAIPKASEDIRALIDLAESGEEVLLTKADVPVVKIIPVSKTGVPECTPNGPVLAAIFEKLAELGGIDIDDPIAWQREIRKDRPLPGRE